MVASSYWKLHWLECSTMVAEGVRRAFVPKPPAFRRSSAFPRSYLQLSPQKVLLIFRKMTLLGPKIHAILLWIWPTYWPPGQVLKFKV